MPSRLRERAPSRAPTRGQNSAVSLSMRPAVHRATRHASIRNYAELSDSEEDEDEESEREDDEQSIHGDEDDAQDSLPDDSDNIDDDELADADFSPGRHRSKRRRLGDRGDASSSQRVTRRQQPQRRTTADSLTGHDAYLSPSSDGAPRRRSKPAAAPSAPSAPPAPSTPSPQKRTDGSERGRSRTAPQKTPTKTKSSPSKSAAGHADAGGVRTPNSAKRAASATPPPATRKAWAALPYFVLTNILAYGAAPLDNIASVRWLLGAARTCRAFAEPALRVLYDSPPLLTMNMAHSLVDMLALDPATTMFDYGNKVKALHIDVGSLATRVYKGRHLDISRLVASCPRLAVLDLYHYKDMPPYREQTENLRWTYPESLFKALGAVPEGSRDGDNAGGATPTAAHPPQIIRLKSWRWNQRLMGRDVTLERVRELHMAPTFAGLRKIGFVNYQRPSLRARNPDDPAMLEADQQHALAFADLLEALPQLTHLVMESSTAANELLLPLLPRTLQHLELINCWDVTAAQFAAYLQSHGQALCALTLHHNQSLSLAFLPVLGDACPQLQALRMNLTYYSHHAFYNDSTPLYECLLEPADVPTWPAALRVLELEHLRRWEPAAADVFFQSLVDAAPRLPQLRVLAIKAMLDIPWRQRCEMRDRWEATLAHVFRRRATAPPAPACSLSYYAEQRRQARRAAAVAAHQAQRGAEPSRRSYRIAVSTSLATASSSTAGRSADVETKNTTTAKPARPSSGRARSSGDRVSYREPDTDEDMDFGSSAEEAEEPEGKEEPEAPEAKNDETDKEYAGLFVQGMCDVVDTRIDNQKPGEIQYRMVDFLDSDGSNSDEEWTADAAEANDYAW